MHHKLVRTTARTAILGAVIVLGGTAAAQGAMAKPVHGAIVSVPCSTPVLISAIASAGSGDKLHLAPGCTYQLTAPLPDINTGLTIVGSGATLERSEADGTPDFTILTVDAGDVNLLDVNFRNGGGGNDNGGAIDNEGGNITVLGGTFADSQAAGGAVYNGSGTLTITRAYFIQNAANYSGGAIVNLANMTLRSSRFFENTANQGGAIYNGGTAAIIGTTFTENEAYEGGALVNSGRAALIYVVIQNNSAIIAVGGGIENGGTLTATSSNIVHNTAKAGGGGIENGGTLTATSSNIVHNTTGDGAGGIDNFGSVTLSRTRVSGNTPDNCEPVDTIAGCSG